MTDVVEISVAATVKDAEGNLTLHSPMKPLIAQSFGIGEDVTITVRAGEIPRTLRQNRAFHALISSWAKSEGHRIDDLKHDVLGEVFGWSETPSPLTGRLLPVEPHSSQLSKEKFILLIERTLEIAAGCGVYLQAPEEYRRAKEEAAKRKAVA